MIVWVWFRLCLCVIGGLARCVGFRVWFSVLGFGDCGTVAGFGLLDFGGFDDCGIVPGGRVLGCCFLFWWILVICAARLVVWVCGFGVWFSSDLSGVGV